MRLFHCAYCHRLEWATTARLCSLWASQQSQDGGRSDWQGDVTAAGSKHRVKWLWLLFLDLLTSYWPWTNHFLSKPWFHQLNMGREGCWPNWRHCRLQQLVGDRGNQRAHACLKSKVWRKILDKGQTKWSQGCKAACERAVCSSPGSGIASTLTKRH